MRAYRTKSVMLSVCLVAALFLGVGTAPAFAGTLSRSEAANGIRQFMPSAESVTVSVVYQAGDGTYIGNFAVTKLQIGNNVQWRYWSGTGKAVFHATSDGHWALTDVFTFEPGDPFPVNDWHNISVVVP